MKTRKAVSTCCENRQTGKQFHSSNCVELSNLPHTPYIEVKNQEINKRALCGCELVQAFDYGPKFYQCELHAAAPDLLEACKNARNVLAGLITGDLKEIKADSPALQSLRNAIAKAEGK